MIVETFWTDKIKSTLQLDGFRDFVQKMSNRMAFGIARYGQPDGEKRYWKRLKMDAKAYDKTGNREHLYNIANYAVLECLAPEHKKHHMDGRVGSVTRGKERGL